MVVFRHLSAVCSALLASVLLLSSCSVKENRFECPVYVTVLTDRFMAKGLESGTVSFSAGSLIKREDISYIDYAGKGYTQPCPRDMARAALVTGSANGKFDEDVLYWPAGRAADRTWSYGEIFSVNADEYVIDAVPHKQYCLIKFMFDDSPVAPPDYYWRFRIRAQYNGLNVYTSEPVEGDYVCPVGPNNIGEWYGVLPRQKENNMKMDIIVPYSDNEKDGRVDFVLDLGKAFEEAGYDWTEADLKDIMVKVGFTSADVNVSIEDWHGDETYGGIDI